MSIETNEEFRPKIVAFCCNWCVTQVQTLQEAAVFLTRLT